MFQAKYVPLMEQERLTYEYLLLELMAELVTKVTKMFIERGIFSPKYAASEQVQMSQCLSMLKKEI